MSGKWIAAVLATFSMIVQYGTESEVAKAGLGVAASVYICTYLIIDTIERRGR